MKINKEDLLRFEKEISEEFLSKKIKVPIHLSGGNEDVLIEIFKHIKEDDWVFSTHRNHYHALLKGFTEKELKDYILCGDCESMHIYSRKYKFFSSSIVGGILPIAVGVAMAIKMSEKKGRVFVFIGDMAAEMGIYHECSKYAARNQLPIIFVIEDNAISVESPTQKVWGESKSKPNIIRYSYKRIWPHTGVGKWVTF